MFRKFAVALALGVSSISLSVPALAQTPAAETVDPARLKLAETMAGKIIPPGSYQKMMKDMAGQMADGMIAQMMGMDAAIIAKAAGDDAVDTQGKSLGEIAAEQDPNFKERMDIMMKVMFDEMGKLMTEMEPAARAGLAKVYARKYTTPQLNDMIAFFSTSSGSAFAGDFMATFTDKEMISAMMGEMPKMMEAMPAIMKKVEEATAHLPPLPTAADAAVEDAAVAGMGAPWWDPENWAAKDRKKYDAVFARYEKATEALDKLDGELSTAMNTATDNAKARYLAEGWKEPAPIPDPSDREQLEQLRTAWSAADNAAVTAQTKTRDTASDKMMETSAVASRAQYLLDAAYNQAMVNAGQLQDGVKRSVAEAIKAAGDDYDSSNAETGAMAMPGDTVSTDAARPPSN